ncbi:MAG: hypothetical protein H6579_07705 [Chitinophagales bacterium]|nr:hypothetical protein [Chitinophagales bacterium]
MKKKNSISYIPILEDIPTQIIIKEMVDFKDLTERKGIEEVFVYTIRGKNRLETKTFFIISDGSNFYKINSQNYNSIEDNIDGLEKGFDSGIRYYEATELEIDNFQDYLDFSTNSSDIKREEFDDFKEKGYLNSEKVDVLKKLTLKKLHRPGYFYKLGNEKNCANIDKLIDLLKSGFENTEDALIAEKMGFSNSEDFKNFQNSDFEEPNQYKNAKQLGINNRLEFEQFEKYKQLMADHEIGFMDQALLIDLIQKKENGTTLGLDKLYDEFVRETSSLKKNKWFSNSLSSKEKLESFIVNISKEKRIVTIDRENGTLTVHKIVKDRIYLDGSNIANYNKDKTGFAELSNIKLIIEKLKILGFSDIQVICDASLRHQINRSEKEELKKLYKDKTLSQSPADTDADDYLIRFAKNNSSLIVTNDKFRDKKEKNKWYDENLDNYLITYMIGKDSEVEFDEKLIDFLKKN